MMAGMVARPALRAARQRLSPAISSYSLSPVWRTRTGCRIPTSRTEAVKAARGVLVEMVAG